MSAQGTREETELPASVAHARVSMSAAAQRNASLRDAACPISTG